MAKPNLTFFAWFIADLLHGDNLVSEYAALVADKSDKVSGIYPIKTSQPNF